MKLSSTFVGHRGPDDARFAFIGEQPGYEEARRRRPFIGPAGKELTDRQMDQADIPEAFSYFSNVIKDFDEQPPAYIQLYDSRNKLLPNPIISDKGRFYLELLKKEVSSLKVNAICAVGGISLFALTGRTGITNWRGSILPCNILGTEIPNVKVVPILHPSTVIKPKNQFLNRRLSVHDLRRYRMIAEGTYVPTQRNIFIEPTFKQVLDYLDYVKSEGLKGNLAGYDIEVFMNRLHKEVSCISFSIGLEGMSIPFVDHDGDYFKLEDEITIWNKINEILSDKRIRKVGQNIVFDSHFLLRKYGIMVTNADDTMIAQKTIMPDYPVGLDFIASWWTDQPYYKKDGKDFLAVGGAYKTFWHYNTLDSIMCTESFPHQYEEVVKQGNEAAYERQRLMIEPCTYMMEKGILTDVAAMNAQADKVEAEIQTIQAELDQLAGQHLNANSSTQLYKYFCEKHKRKPYTKYDKKNKKSVPTFDETAMKRLARDGFREEAGRILAIRRLVKQKSTYLEVEKVDPDNRNRCAYKPVGTRYSRLASAENIFGTGGNHQNWPHALQNFLLPDKNYVYYAYDLDQAENRIVAYVGEISNMIEVFETGVDVHAKTARFIVRVFLNQDVDETFDTKQICPIGDGTKDWRFWGKKSNHGFNYNLQYEKFSLTNEIPEKQGKLIYNAYHTLYPGVQKSYHAFVRRCLRENRTLVNLLDRKTVFMDALNDATYNEAFACIPQGSVGDIINERGIEYIYYNQDIFSVVDILRQVHDEIGFQIPLDVPWRDHAYLLSLIKNSLETPLTTHYGRTFVVPASLTVGKCLNKEIGEEIKAKNFPNDIDVLADILKDRWEKLHANS